MRRVVGVIAVAALALALCPIVALAAGAPLAGGFDLRPQLMLQLFGEDSDTSASFAAAYGDRVSESPLRGLALQIQPTDQLAAFAPPVALAPRFEPSGMQGADASEQDAPSLAAAATQAFSPNSVHFEPSQTSSGDAGAASLAPSNASFTAAYQPVAAAPNVSPGPGTVAFGPLTSAAAAVAVGPHSTTLQIGHVQFEGHAEGASTEAPQASLHDNTYNAGASFDVRTGQRNLNVNLTSSYEHVARNDSAFSSSTLDSTSAWQLPGAAAPFVIPNYADLNRFSVGAGVAVPVLRGLTLNLNYDAEHFYGGYGLPGLMNLDAVNNSYGGKLTFDIPHTANTLSVSAYQNRYQDSVLPINGYTGTREDVNFTVKF